MLLSYLILLLINVSCSILIYCSLYKKRKLFTDRYGMVITMICSGTLNLSVSLNLQFLFLEYDYLVILVSVTLGCCIGILFGSLVRFQSLLAGFYNGIVGSLMGNMLGAVVKDPSICSLPTSYFTNMEQNMMVFGLFSTTLVLLSNFLVFYSFKI